MLNLKNLLQFQISPLNPLVLQLCGTLVKPCCLVMWVWLHFPRAGGLPQLSPSRFSFTSPAIYAGTTVVSFSVTYFWPRGAGHFTLLSTMGKLIYFLVGLETCSVIYKHFFLLWNFLFKRILWWKSPVYKTDEGRTAGRASTSPFQGRLRALCPISSAPASLFEIVRPIQSTLRVTVQYIQEDKLLT